MTGLWDNRNRLIAWQRDAYARKAEEGVLRLHLGSGRQRYPGYANVDLYESSADYQIDMCDLSVFPDNSVDDIACHHALEHVPLRNVEPALREWYRVLKPGGRLDLGLPDIELLARDFINASEADKWNKIIWQIYGLQSSIYDLSDTSLEIGQTHKAGLSAARLKALLEAIGFKILEIFNYDANGCASSVWVLAEKRSQPPEVSRQIPSVFEQDVVMGTFTNRTTYLPALLASCQRHLPHIPFEIVMQDKPINANMTALRERFMASGKRYWIFLDDDIQFLNGSVVHDAVFDLVQNKWAAAGVYSTFDPVWLDKPYTTQGLVTRQTTWVTGYFILVDSWKVGDVQPDLNLPDGNTSVDTSYSASILARGFDVGLSANLVYHQKKQVWAKPDIVAVTNDYLRGKWGSFYHDRVRYDGNVLEWSA
jgi:predicted SAM-dependent methyltransferase